MSDSHPLPPAAERDGASDGARDGGMRWSQVLHGRYSLAAAAMPRTPADYRRLLQERVGALVVVSPQPPDAAALAAAGCCLQPFAGSAAAATAPAHAALSTLFRKAATAFSYLHLPVPLGSVPTLEQVEQLLQFLTAHYHAPADKQRYGAAVACDDGLSTAPIFVCCMLIARGAARDAAHALLIMRRECPGALPLAAQEAVVKRWSAVRERNFSFVLQAGSGGGASAAASVGYESGSRTVGSLSGSGGIGGAGGGGGQRVAGMIRPGRLRRLSSDLQFLTQHGVGAIVTVSEDPLDARAIADTGYNLVPLSPRQRAAVVREQERGAPTPRPQQPASTDASSTAFLPVAASTVDAAAASAAAVAAEHEGAEGRKALRLSGPSAADEAADEADSSASRDHSSAHEDHEGDGVDIGLCVDGSAAADADADADAAAVAEGRPQVLRILPPHHLSGHDGDAATATAAAAAADGCLTSPTVVHSQEGRAFHYLWLPICIYRAPSQAQIGQFIKFLDDVDARPIAPNRRDVAVHCQAGQGRTGTLLACAMMRRQGLTAAQAIAQLRHLRPGSIESAEQEAAVYEYEKTLLAEAAAAAAADSAAAAAAAAAASSPRLGSGRGSSVPGAGAGAGAAARVAGARGARAAAGGAGGANLSERFSFARRRGSSSECGIM